MPPLASVSPVVSASVAAAVASSLAVAVTAAFFGAMCAPPRPAPVAAPPREGVPVPRLVAVPRAGDDRGGETALATVRALPADAAVGLLSLERSTLRGTLGGGGGGAALRTLASDAAVGANRPDVGMEGRGIGGTDGTPAAAAASARALAPFDDGVFGRGVVFADVVRVLAVVIVRGSVDGALRVPVPFDGVERGVGVLEPVARAVAGDGRALGADDVDFEGEAGVLARLGGSVDGRDVGADARGLIDGAATGAGTGAGAGAGAEARAGESCVVMGPSPSAVDETAGGGQAAAVDVSGGHGCSSGVSSSDVRDACVDAVPRNVAAVEAVPFVSPFVLTGGHSRAMRCSSFTASLVLLEVALAAREGGPDDEG